jgi:hypothetical protein
MLEEPPPFAFSRDDDQVSSDSASPPFSHRVHFDDDGTTNDDEATSHAPSPLPFALSSNNLNEEAADNNNSSKKQSAHDVVYAQHTNVAASARAVNEIGDFKGSSLSYHSAMQEYNHGNDHATTADIDGPGITILDEDEESSIHRQSVANSDCETQTTTTTSRRPASSSFFQTQIIDDSIVAGAADHVDANPNNSNISSIVGGAGNYDGDVSSILNQLMQYANDDDDDALPQIRENEIRDEQLSIDGNVNYDDDADIIMSSSSSSSRRFWEWPIQYFTMRRKRTKQQQTSHNNVPTAALTNPTRAPIRAHRIRHDKYIVEVDIMPPSSSLSTASVDIRDAIDILANIELLHLWFEPIPAVFDACTKDGSGNNNLQSSSSPRNSPANSLNSSNESTNYNNNNNVQRQYDGEWIEISSSLLALPSDARVSSCLRATRVGLRQLIGFPARVRSMMFVERIAGRVGLTLGPYPDRLFHGTMAHHTFHVSVVSDEEYGVGGSMGGQKIVISDEVRLQREGDDEVGFNGKRNGYCYCAVFRVLFALLEWITVLWYQPDLASYMAQTISSMEKLRTLIERGETGAHAGGELVMEAEDWEGGGGGDGNTSMRSPLLG